MLRWSSHLHSSKSVVVYVYRAVLGVVLLLTSLLLNKPAPLALVNGSAVLLEILVSLSLL
jgi:hypothetical protein